MDWFSPQLATILRAYVQTPNDVRENQAQMDEYVQMVLMSLKVYHKFYCPFPTVHGTMDDRWP
jgi:hypothetical protein